MTIDNYFQKKVAIMRYSPSEIYMEALCNRIIVQSSILA